MYCWRLQRRTVRFESTDREEPTLACQAGFVMVALGPDGRPMPVPPVQSE